MEQSVSFYSEGQKIFANLSSPCEGAPCILLSHGLESSKDGNKWLILASILSDEGYASLRFSYRGCGEGPEKSEGEFQTSTLTNRIKDYKAAVHYLEQSGVDVKRLGVIGSSFGGTVALAASVPGTKALVTLAAPSRMPPISKDSTADLKASGLVQVESGHLLPSTIYEDAGKYDICEAARTIGCPLLIIHGSDDEVVPVKHAHELYNSAREPKRLEMVRGANHSFDTPEHLEQAIAPTLEWLNKYLRS
jgi:dipeptidyl aminopeptidase/acylaminoacyl peptidase